MQQPGEGLAVVVSRFARLVAASVLCIAFASCGASKRPAMAPASSATTMPAGADSGVMPGDPKQEIERLFAELEQKRTELDLPEPKPAPASEGATPMSVTPLSTDATCKPAKTERCASSCTFSDSICTNAEKICKLAGQLAGDPWAADKCSRAKQTCATAHTSCCGCH